MPSTPRRSISRWRWPTRGAKRALLDDPHFLGGLNVCGGGVTEEHVATALGYEYVDAATAIKERCGAAY